MNIVLNSVIRLSAVASVVLVTAGWTTVGQEPSRATFTTFGSSDEDASRDRLAGLYARNPHDPFVELALAESYQNVGRWDLAEPFYRGVVVDGKGIVPPATAYPSDGGKSLDQIACSNLRMMAKDTSGC
jgi:hypothetical protein